MDNKVIMQKKVNTYQVSINQISNKEGESVQVAPIEFLFENHDDVFGIVQKIKEKQLFDDENDSKQFAIGLKLFGDCIIKNKNHELFSEMQPAFIAFMKKLKSK